MSIAANKFRGIYAARCLTVEDAELARQINNANVLCLAARTGLVMNEAIVHAFMITPYEGRKLEQLSYISELEMKAMEPALAAKRRFA
jgi:ribose 5-phosphate isomerase B